LATLKAGATLVAVLNESTFHIIECPFYKTRCQSGILRKLTFQELPLHQATLGVLLRGIGVIDGSYGCMLM